MNIHRVPHITEVKGTPEEATTSRKGSENWLVASKYEQVKFMEITPTLATGMYLNMEKQEVKILTQWNSTLHEIDFTNKINWYRKPTKEQVKAELQLFWKQTCYALVKSTEELDAVPEVNTTAVDTKKGVLEYLDFDKVTTRKSTPTKGNGFEVLSSYEPRKEFSSLVPEAGGEYAYPSLQDLQQPKSYGKWRDKFEEDAVDFLVVPTAYKGKRVNVRVMKPENGASKHFYDDVSLMMLPVKRIAVGPCDRGVTVWAYKSLGENGHHNDHSGRDIPMIWVRALVGKFVIKFAWFESVADLNEYLGHLFRLSPLLNWKELPELSPVIAKMGQHNVEELDTLTTSIKEEKLKNKQKENIVEGEFTEVEDTNNE